MPASRDAKTLQEFIEARLQALIAEANEVGFGTEDVLDGLSHAVREQRHAYEEDPDPADDPGLEARRAARVRVPKNALEEIDTAEGTPQHLRSGRG